MSVFVLSQYELGRRPVLLTFAYGKQVEPYRRTWQAIIRLGRRNLQLILAWNILFAMAYAVALIYIAIGIYGKGAIAKVIWPLLFFTLPLARMVPNIVKLYLFLKGRGYRG